MKTLSKIILGVGALGAVVGAPIIPTDTEWVRSYETPTFQTANGDLGMNEYAVSRDGFFYVRDVPQNVGNFTTSQDTGSILGKTEVKVIAEKSEANPDCVGCSYYSEFKLGSGRVVRVPFRGRYKDLEEVKNSPQPRHTEYVSVLSGRNADAAIARDNATDGGFVGGASSISFSHTNTGSDLILFGMLINDTSRTSTGATYNSVSMTQAGSDLDWGDDHNSAVFYLVNPATGSNTLVLNISGTATVVGAASSYTGADQSSPIDNQTTSTSTADPLAVSVTVNTANSWMVSVAGFQNNTTSVAAGSNTSLATTMISGETRFAVWDTNSAQSTGSQTMNYNPDTAASFVGVQQVVFKPAAAAGGNTETTFDVVWWY